MRVHVAIARSGLMSRRAAEELVVDGEVTINGAVAKVGDRVDVEVDRVEVEGVPLPVRPELRYLLVNKPPGVVCTVSDPQSRTTVVSLVPAEPRVYPVGRLDVDSEGLIILTNDGELTNLLTHPRYRVTKTYAVLVAGVVDKRALKRLTEGIELDDGIARAQSVRLLGTSQGKTHVELVMTEGKKREIRRMMEAVGYGVDRLFRTAIGPVTDASLRAGAWRPLSIVEVRSLYGAAHR